MAEKRRRTLPKRHKTKYEGVFYKVIEETAVDDSGRVVRKEVDKVYLIRYKTGQKERVVTMGKHSQGIRANYCKEKRAELMVQEKNGELPPIVKKRKRKVITLDEVAAMHYDNSEARSRAKLRSRYENHVKPALGDEDIAVIDSDRINDLKKKLEKKLSPKMVNMVLGELSAIFNFAITRGIVNSNPASAKLVKRLNVDNDRERFLSLGEIELLKEKVRGEPDLHLFALLALSTGARIGAICSIRRKDVNVDVGTITLMDEKSAKTYTGYISEELREPLARRLLGLAPNDLILDFKKPGVNAIDRHIQKRLQPILDELFNVGLDPDDRKNRVVIHTLRHTFASHLAMNGAPILTIQKLMNHKDIKMTLRYAKLAPDSGAEAVRGLYKRGA